MKDFFVYIVRCSDGSYYTGVTSNLEKRIAEHNSGLIKGYTSKRLPLELVYSNRFNNVSDAIRSEKQIKGWRRDKKEALVQQNFEALVKLSKTRKK
jgi:putative endonuclease